MIAAQSLFEKLFQVLGHFTLHHVDALYLPATDSIKGCFQDRMSRLLGEK
jgi:hypothetical protein